MGSDFPFDWNKHEEPYEAARSSLETYLGLVTKFSKYGAHEVRSKSGFFQDQDWGSTDHDYVTFSSLQLS